MNRFCLRMMGTCCAFVMFTAVASANCGNVAPHSGGQRMAPSATLSDLAWRLAQGNALQTPDGAETALQGEGKGDHDNSDLVGFWRTTLVSDAGLVVDIGFDQFHPDGMENAVDSPAPSSGNVCLGIWEKAEHRPWRYEDLHPSFNWDASGNVISIFVERLQIYSIARNGKTFSGTFTWDSYDFQGNVIPDAHVEGTLTGDRITMRGSVPFPFAF